MKALLSATAALECATGVAIVIAPAVMASLLLGSPLEDPAGVTIARVAAIALLALGVACWLARDDGASRAARGLIAGMLLYNVAVVALLAYAWISSGLRGVGLWPTVLVHAAFAAWCIASLARGAPPETPR